MRRICLLVALIWGVNAALTFAFAHEGHGLEGAHAHPSDVWGFLILGLVMVLALWFTRKK
jgi:hypothetical protein